jgi:hypothetical protein
VVTADEFRGTLAVSKCTMGELQAVVVVEEGSRSSTYSMICMGR